MGVKIDAPKLGLKMLKNRLKMMLKLDDENGSKIIE
jgi:hypothetical protein